MHPDQKYANGSRSDVFRQRYGTDFQVNFKLISLVLGTHKIVSKCQWCFPK